MPQQQPQPKKEEVKITKEADEPAKAKLSLKAKAAKGLRLVQHHQVIIITIAIFGLLALTTLRMLHYANPETDNTRVQENLTKVKQVHIDQKIVEKIKKLSGSNEATGTDLENSRTNPFAED